MSVVVIHRLIRVVKGLRRVKRVVKVVKEEEYLEKAFKLAVNANTTVYDTLYISLALDKGLPLLTSDIKQGRIAERLGVKVITV